MPTLIRLAVILLLLVGLAYAAMFALVTFVTPTEKEVTLRLPARDLLPQTERQPIVRREIDTTRPVPPPAEPVAPPAEPDEPEAGEDDDGIVTLSPGIE